MMVFVAVIMGVVGAVRVTRGDPQDTNWTVFCSLNAHDKPDTNVPWAGFSWSTPGMFLEGVGNLESTRLGIWEVQSNRTYDDYKKTPEYRLRPVVCLENVEGDLQYE